MPLKSRKVLLLSHTQLLSFLKHFITKHYVHEMLTLHTVEPCLYGHQGDMRKCPYYRGVCNKRVIFLKEMCKLAFRRGKQNCP